VGKMSRNKGAQGEREFAALLSAALNKEIKRKLGAARDGGDDVEAAGFSFEVKRQEHIAIERWMAQALANKKANIPVVVFRKNGGRWSACLDLDDFFQLMRRSLV
jgi:hypothetical protein